MSVVDIALAAGMAAGFPLLGLWIARRDRKRLERIIARRPIANRYADSTTRVWR